MVFSIRSRISIGISVIFMLMLNCGEIAVVQMGSCQCQMDFQQNLHRGDVIFVPAGTWHNVINIGVGTLKVSSIYAPPNHKRGTVHRTQAEAQMEE
jgi:mannose-6-phosphate isomerase-like protein (cupin superfamily)